MFSFSARRNWTLVAAVVAVSVGLVTIGSGGSVLLGNEEVVRAAGDYVAFVVWFNALAGFAYVAAGIGLWLRRPWAVGLALAIAALSLVVLAALLAHIALGGPYELRTLIAMMVRTAMWAAIAAVAYLLIWNGRDQALSY